MQVFEFLGHHIGSAILNLLILPSYFNSAIKKNPKKQQKQNKEKSC